MSDYMHKARCTTITVIFTSLILEMRIIVPFYASLTICNAVRKEQMSRGFTQMDQLLDFIQITNMHTFIKVKALTGYSFIEGTMLLLQLDSFVVSCQTLRAKLSKSVLI